jgi:chitinase
MGRCAVPHITNSQQLTTQPKPTMRSALLTSLVFLILVLAPLQLRADPPSTDAAPTFRIVGYLPDYRIAEINLDNIKNVTDLMIFSAEPTAEGDLDMSRLKNTDWNKLKTFKDKNHVRLVLCVGGWGRSTHFASISQSEKLRQRFIESLTRTCLEKNLDGVDFDWEHPKDAAEELGYAALLSDCHHAFQVHDWSVSVTIAAWQGLHPKAIEAVDHVQVMSYDNPERHSTLQSAKSDIAKLIKDGIPARKLVLGVPFYGRQISNHDRVLTYREIIAKQPKITGDEFEGYFFNGPKTVEAKTRFALQSKLAGIMIWELGQDASPPQSLLEVISQTLKN